MESKNKTKEKPKTIFDLINDNESGIPMESAKAKEQLLIGKKRGQSQSERTISQVQPNKSDTLSYNNNLQQHQEQEQQQSKYHSMLKPKIFLVDGKMQVQKPDIGLINKQINEEISKNSIPLMTYNANKRITSLSFKDIHHTNKWTELENKLFYKAIEVFGLDFSFLEIVLQPRKRGEIKRKYLKEGKVNSKLVDKATNSKKNIEKMIEILAVYKRQDIDEKSKIEEFHSILLKKRKKDKQNDEKIQEMINELSKGKANIYDQSNENIDNNSKINEIDEDNEEEDENDEDEEKENDEEKEEDKKDVVKIKKSVSFQTNVGQSNTKNVNKNDLSKKEKDAKQLFADQILNNFN